MLLTQQIEWKSWKMNTEGGCHLPELVSVANAMSCFAQQKELLMTKRVILAELGRKFSRVRGGGVM